MPNEKINVLYFARLSSNFSFLYPSFFWLIFANSPHGTDTPFLQHLLNEKRKNCLVHFDKTGTAAEVIKS